jgi:hypothetical protein
MLSIAADERAALQFDEVASMLDAGLPLGSIGGGGEHGDRVVHAILSQRGVKLTPSDDTVLLAAWRAGRIGPALRARAEQRRQQAALHRRLLLGLAYPSALFAMTIVAGIVTAPIVGHYYFPIGLSVLLLAVVATALVVQRGLQRGDERWNQLPVIGPIARDVAEIPYLEVLQALYGAGVPLLEAHASATAAVPNHGVQQRLGVAGRVLGEGRGAGPVGRPAPGHPHAAGERRTRRPARGRLAARPAAPPRGQPARGHAHGGHDQRRGLRPGRAGRDRADLQLLPTAVWQLGGLAPLTPRIPLPHFPGYATPAIRLQGTSTWNRAWVNDRSRPSRRHWNGTGWDAASKATARRSSR